MQAVNHVAKCKFLLLRGGQTGFFVPNVVCDSMTTRQGLMDNIGDVKQNTDIVKNIVTEVRT
jgi:hypothetical protein